MIQHAIRQLDGGDDVADNNALNPETLYEFTRRVLYEGHDDAPNTLFHGRPIADEYLPRTMRNLTTGYEPDEAPREVNYARGMAEPSPSPFTARRSIDDVDHDIGDVRKFMIETFTLMFKRFLITEEQYRGVVDLIKNDGITPVVVDLLKAINKGDF
jgi:hypothetical protein